MAVSSMSPVFAAGDGKAAAQQAQAAAAAVEAKVESLQESIAEIGESDAYKAAKEALTALKADSTNIATKVPTDAAKLEAYNKKLALYETAVNACKALTEAEKDAMDIDLMLWFLREVVNRESFLDGGTGAANIFSISQGKPDSHNISIFYINSRNAVICCRNQTRVIKANLFCSRLDCLIPIDISISHAQMPFSDSSGHITTLSHHLW